MRHARLVLMATLAALATTAALAPAGASAHVPHVVAPGETLWSIAAQSNLTTRTLAAFNGLSPESQVVLGSTIHVPSVAEGAAALAGQGAAPAAETATADTPAAQSAAGPAPQGAYTVRPGDTLGALAAQSGVPVEQMAYMNGLDPAAPLLAGTAIKLPVGSPVASAQPASAQPVAQPAVVPAAAPQASPAVLDETSVKSLAAEQGAPAALAAAIGWQESGFNNAMVSSANARGVMQVLPGTWDWIQQNLTDRRLDPSSAEDNVRAGSLYLGRLLNETGGDEALAAAGYYQGLASVRRIGMLPETQQYVANVMALKGRFGG